MQKDNLTKVYKGLVQDTSPVDQPEGTYRFALNAVDESVDGDINKLSNEKGNLIISSISKGYKPIGNIYMIDKEFTIFSVGPNGESEIGIFDGKDNTYTKVINDSSSIKKLEFDLNHPISGIYRLRRGCEKTIYFVDGKSVRYFNYNKINNFLNNGLVDADLFKLQRTLKTVPNFTSVSIQDGGNVKPGAYSATIQFLDEDLNPTEWLISTDTVILYADKDNKPFEDILGDFFISSDDTEPTYIDKAIRFQISNLDKSFPYYRIGIIPTNDGKGITGRVLVSEPIPTEIDNYLFTGSETTVITFEETQVFDTILEAADHIEAIDNCLLLSKVKAKSFNYCNLQNYASRIKVDCTTKEINLNDISTDSNPKRGTVHFESVGYQPGELYSLGIVYVFADGTKSPAYHIPGKNLRSANRVYVSGTIPMSTNNQITTTYTSSDNNCSPDSTFWGVDCEGDELNELTKVRHHRFPTREEANIGFVKTEISESEGSVIRTLNFTFRSTHKKSNLGDNGPARITIHYYIGGEKKTVIREIESFILAPNTYFTIEVDTIINKTLDGERADGVVTKYEFLVEELEDEGDDINLRKYIKGESLFLTEGSSEVFVDKTYKANIMGLVLSGIELPDTEDDNKIIGYYIVRNKRTETTKTILDTGLLLPTLKETHYTAFGLLKPSKANGNANGDRSLDSRLTAFLDRNESNLQMLYTKYKNDAFGLIHPQFLFNRKEYPTAKYRIDGCFKNVDNKSYMQHTITQDVMAGTSYDSSRNKKREKDSDGFDLHTLTRYTALEYNKYKTTSDLTSKDIFYLDTLFGKTLKDTQGDSFEVYNLSADNRIGIIQTNNKADTYNMFKDNSYPYVTLYRDLPDAYSNFRVLPYYLDSKQMHNFDSESITLFSGDSYISPMNFTSSMYYNTKIRKRKTKKSFLKFLLSAVLIAVAVVINIIPGVGQALSAVIGTLALSTLTASAVALAISMASNGFKQAQANKVYNDLYDKGLKDCINDGITSEVFDNHNPDDDEVQWVGDTLANIWFESQINMNWRVDLDKAPTDFQRSPSKYSESSVGDYLVNKLTSFDEKNTEGKLYNGFASPEIYLNNPDYSLRNSSKLFTMIGLEYDCCSECLEYFPNRTYYSQQSFQEELTDNYRKFLPNNYKDLDGETGNITNMFKLGNNLYLHTEEALWLVPRNYQERVTDQIVSFLGTGEFFSVPPQKIMDSSFGKAAGLRHKLASVKTPHGYFYFCSSENVLYQFNGNQSVDLNQTGLNKFLLKRMPQSQFGDNPFIDKPSIVLGYDSNLDRVILTKHDNYKLSLSFSPRSNSFKSFHSYYPIMYLTTTDVTYNMYKGEDSIYRMSEGSYGVFNKVKYPFIVDYISNSSAVQTRTINDLTIMTQAYDKEVDVYDITFDEILVYNSRQCSGYLKLIPKKEIEDFFVQSTQDKPGEITYSRREKDYHLNNFRDIRVNYNLPIFLDSTEGIILSDKFVNTTSLDLNKPWEQLETFTDKYFSIRLKYNNTQDIKLLFNLTLENEQPEEL